MTLNHTTIDPSRIIVKPNRQRQEHDPDKHQELKSSIEDRGLMHPPVLRREGDDMVLVAGERRLRAIQEIFALGGQFKCGVRPDGVPWYYSEAEGMPYLDVGSLSHLEAEEAELDENLKRKDLTWQEHAAAVERLHKLRQEQKAVATKPEPMSNGWSELPPVKEQTIADTALELHGRSDGSFQDSVRKELIVAKHLDNPVIAKAKSADEAFKLLKQQEARRQNEELAKVIGATFSADKHQIIQGDCLDWMAAPEAAGTIDVICTDPLYGMDAHKFGDGGGKFTGIEHHYDDTYENWQRIMTKWAALAFAVTKPQAHAYVCCDFDRFHELKAMMQAAGWYVFRTPIIIHKLNSGRVPLPDQGPRRQYELVLYAIKGKKPVTQIYPDVIPVQGDANDGHGAQKPVALWTNLLQRSVRPGDKVLDSFGGTGGVMEAAHGLKCEATIIELTQEYYGQCLRRAQQLKALEQPGLPGL